MLRKPGAPSEDSFRRLLQEIPSENNEIVKTFFDAGSTCALVDNEFARRSNLKGTDVTIELITVGKNVNKIKTKLYCITLLDNNKEKHKIFAYGLDEISSEITAVRLGSVEHKFKGNSYCGGRQLSGGVKVRGG